MQKKILNKEYWDTLIIDWLSDNILEKDAQTLKEWLKESKKHLSYFNQMKELWDSSTVADLDLPFDYEKAYSLFVNRIDERSSVAPVFMSKRINVSFWRKIIIVAAVIIPIIILGYYTSLNFFVSTKTVEPFISEIVSPNGSKTQLCLADGTIVWLNSGSRLLYNDKFGKENRILELIGEAYLDVKHNEQIPLIVKAKGVDIKVLGTKFNVNAYSDNNEVRVSLLKGSVSMTANNSSEPTILKPMETGVYQSNSHHITVKSEFDSNALAWMNNQLVFVGETFEEIALILERRFDVKINIHNEILKKRHFGGDFNEGDSIDKILKIMAVNGKFEYSVKNKIINIY